MIILSVILSSTLMTYFLSKSKYFCPIRSSATVTIIASVVTHSLGSQYLLPYIFTATFAGMSAINKLSWQQLVICSFSIHLIFLSKIFSTSIFGGTYGFIAFVSCLTVYYLNQLVSRFTKGAK